MQLHWAESFITRFRRYAPKVNTFAMSFSARLPSDFTGTVESFDWERFATSAVKSTFPALERFALRFETAWSWRKEDYETVEKAFEPIIRNTRLPISIEWGEGNWFPQLPVAQAHHTPIDDPYQKKKL